jgi:hypothetical protein
MKPQKLVGCKRESRGFPRGNIWADQEFLTLPGSGKSSCICRSKEFCTGTAQVHRGEELEFSVNRSPVFFNVHNKRTRTNIDVI